MMMNASHIRENIFTESEAKKLGLKTSPNINYHGLGETLFFDVIENLDNVKEAYRGTKKATDTERRENYFLLISQHIDGNGDVINIPVYINKRDSHNDVFIDTNKIATVFGRSNISEYIRRQISDGNLVRIKKRNINPSESTSPINAGYVKDVSDNSISHPDGIVKKKFALSNSTTLEQDTEYLELAKNPEKNEARLSEMVEEAA